MPIVAVTPGWIPVPVTRSVWIDWPEIWASKVNKKCIYKLNTLNTCSSKRSEIFQFSVEGSTGKKVGMSGVLRCLRPQTISRDYRLL